MHSTRTGIMHTRSTRLNEEQGVALIIAVLLLLLVTAIGVAAIHHAGDEASVAGSARRSARMLHAADGGLQVAINQIAQPTPDLTPFTHTLEGGDVTIRSGARTDTAAQPIIAAGSGPPPDGYQINVGSGFRSRLYRANVTSLYRSGANSELEGKFGKLEIGNGGY
jgi:hypothetical protein